MALPHFPKLIAGNPSETLVLQAKPDNSLIVLFNSTVNLTIQPKEVKIQHPVTKAEFQLTGNKCGVEMLSYDLKGMNKYDFDIPETSFIFIGSNMSSAQSIYTRLGLLVGELPKGCQKVEIKNYPFCPITVTFASSNSISNESGPVHIITHSNKTIPLSVVGYNFSLPHPSRKEIIERLNRQLHDDQLLQRGDHKPNGQLCPVLKLTGKDLLEFIQKDALPRSYMRYFTDQLPFWLRVKVIDANDLFDVGNIMANLVQTKEAHTFDPTCKFPNSNQSMLILYRPTVIYKISVENEDFTLSSRDSCFATDLCRQGVFLTLPQEASKNISTMHFMQDMAGGGWELLVSSFGHFPTPKRCSRTLDRQVPNGHLAEDFSDFRYNLWLQGSANIYLNNSNYFGVHMKMVGEAFAFADDLNAVSTTHNNNNNYNNNNNSFLSVILLIDDIII